MQRTRQPVDTGGEAKPGVISVRLTANLVTLDDLISSLVLRLFAIAQALRAKRSGRCDRIDATQGRSAVVRAQRVARLRIEV
ncbi:hypothetical protein [Xanthomonas arboricola]|uniref:hypothetical protein n=1 Tax=Xanthomonas arboricola TaxID=56448 RepID=UPI001622159B|nr:hypothetical protein [Xanthomonas arboricola]MBB5676624.1 hypothetical protein [Xanthomonas arboricola]